MDGRTCPEGMSLEQFEEVAYYRCSKCGTSQKPWDQTLGLTGKTLTTAAAQVTAQAGVESRRAFPRGG